MLRILICIVIQTVLIAKFIIYTNYKNELEQIRCKDGKVSINPSNDILITLQRNSETTGSPEYRISVNWHGEIKYENLKSKTIKTAIIEANKVRTLVDYFNKYNFLCINSELDSPINMNSRNPACITSIRYNNKTKSVSRFSGNDIHPVIIQLEHEIDKILESDKFHEN